MAMVASYVDDDDLTACVASRGYGILLWVGFKSMSKDELGDGRVCSCIARADRWVEL